MKEEMGRDIKVLKSLESWGKMKNQGSLVTLMTRGWVIMKDLWNSKLVWFELMWTLIACWLPFTGMKGAMQSANREKLSMV